VSHAARGERVDDFGALNSALPDPEPNPAAAVPEAALGLPPEIAEGVPDAPAATAAGGDSASTAAPKAGDPVAEAADATAEAPTMAGDPVAEAAEATAEAPATAGSSQVA
jgi:hypothetical protein